MDELYDLKADPFEMKNLITDPEAQSVLQDLKGELDRAQLKPPSESKE
jgi:hypothetical protein